MPNGRWDAPMVSIPSRGSGKGDVDDYVNHLNSKGLFQSPLGELVKETKT